MSVDFSCIRSPHSCSSMKQKAPNRCAVRGFLWNIDSTLLRVVWDFLDPDVAEAHGVAVVLHLQESFVVVLGVFANRVWAGPAGAAGKLDVVLDLDAVVDDGEFGASGDFAFFVKDRAVEGDVVGLPLAGFTTGIHEWLGTAI